MQGVLSEDGEGGDISGGYGGMDIASGMSSPYGVSFGSGNDLINTFVKPFTDVVKTAMGKSKEIVRKTGTLVTVAFQSVLTTIIPIYGYNYADVFDREKEDIEKIRGEYKDVYDSTWDALKSSDAALLAFMASPAVVLGYAAAKQSPAVVKGMMSTVSGGTSDKILDKAMGLLSKSERAAMGDDTGGGRPDRQHDSGKRSPSDFDFNKMGESQVNEEDQPNQKLTARKLLGNKKLISKVTSTPEAIEMQKNATKVYRKSLADVYAQAEELMKKTKTVEDLQKASKKPIPDVDKIKKLPPEEKQKAEQILIDNTRKALKKFYVAELTGQVKKVLEAGIPEDAQYVKDYRATIAKISAL